MDRANSSTSNSLPNDFICPVCKDVLQIPVKTTNCEHVFCRQCLVTSIRLRGAICPLCRGIVSIRDKFAPNRAPDIEVEMKKHSGSCMYCTKKVKFYYMRNHYKNCKSYQEEFGILTKTSKQETQELLPLYTCPLCQSDTWSRTELLEHCSNTHSSGVYEAVCPICASLPWGDPHFKIADIVSHLNARHRFNHADFMDLNIDEDEQFRAALQESTSH